MRAVSPQGTMWTGPHNVLNTNNMTENYKSRIWSVFTNIIMMIIIILMQSNLQSDQLIWESIAENNHSYKNIFLHTSTESVAFLKLILLALPPKNPNINTTETHTLGDINEDVFFHCSESTAEASNSGDNFYHIIGISEI